MRLLLLDRENVGGVSTLLKMLSQLRNVCTTVLLEIPQVEVTLGDGVVLGAKSPSNRDLEGLISVETGRFLDGFPCLRVPAELGARLDVLYEGLVGVAVI